jgi:tRNA(Ile)-lysidine synthase TilS/MesJ
MAPLVKPHKEEYPAVIRPLALVPEDLICQAAAEFDFPRKTGVCRYEETVKNGDRAQFKELVSKLAEKIPDLRENIAHSLTRVEIDHLLIPPSADEP